MFVFDMQDWKLRMANRSALEAFGCPDRDPATLSVKDLLPKLSESAWQSLEQQLTDGGTVPVETTLRNVRGGEDPVILQLTRLRGSEHFVHAKFDTATADRHRHLFEAALLRSMIDTAPDAIITIEHDCRIRSFSPAAEKLFGYSEQEVIGRNISMLMPEPFRSEHDRYIARYLETGEKRIIGKGRTVVARHRSGRRIPVELAVGEVNSGPSHIFTGFIRDISQRVAAEERASRLQQELSHISRLSAMSEMASLIVHELNQPLTAIANFGEAAKRMVETGGSTERTVEFIEKSIIQAHRASEMIRRLRSFVARGEIKREPVDVNEVVREAALLALVGASDEHIRTDFNLAEDLPLMIADRIQIQQVIVNLIRNAVEAVLEVKPDGGCDRRILVETNATADGSVEIAVTDSGSGLSEGTTEDIFQPFVSTKLSGMGIGLSVSRSIVEAHGGKIWAERPADGGARVIFTLPPGSGEEPL